MKARCSSFSRWATWGTWVSAGSVALLVFGCATSGHSGDDKDGQVDANCGNGVLEPGEQCDDGNITDGDGCDALCRVSGCGDNCVCSPRRDVTDLIDTNELFVGMAVEAIDISIPGCGEVLNAKELYVSMTPNFDGDLVLSTAHPSTHANTVIEVRQGSCDGTALDCANSATAGTHGARLTIPVQAGQPLVAMVETADDAAGVFALGLHPAGVCEGIGAAQDITNELLSGQKFVVDTLNSSASMRGSCSAGQDSNPEALLTFTPSHSGGMVATTAHPDTYFNALLYVREGTADGETYCDSPEAELGCSNDVAPWGTAPVLHFDVQAGLPYSLFVDGGSADGRGEATVVLGYALQSPADETLEGCDHIAIRDDYAVFAEAGQDMIFHADTTVWDTAADLRMRIRNPNGIERHVADDDVTCSFEPPQYSCPRYQTTIDTTGLYYIEIYVGASQQCREPTLADYRLNVTADGQPVELILFRDQ
jgi:cysteine-rich repeat protein